MIVIFLPDPVVGRTLEGMVKVVAVIGVAIVSVMFAF